jgi:imidazolonepropionase-like amidohydrolase
VNIQYKTWALWTLSILIGAAASTAAGARDLLIEHVTVVSAERQTPLQNASVSIHDGRISNVVEGTATRAAPGPGTEVIEGRGMYLAPGLIDTHVHLGEIPGMTSEQEQAHPDIAQAARDQIPRSYLYSGFTTLIDLISMPAAMARWKKHDPVPDTYFCGAAALMDGYPMNYVPQPARYTAMPYMLVEPGAALPAGIDAAQHTPQAVIARMKADGAICVKTFFERGFGGVHDLPVPKPETIRALVEAAHAAGLPVLMHANTGEAQTFALDTGVDIIAHGLWNVKEPAGPPVEFTPEMKTILDRVIQAKVGWQPTNQVLHGLQDMFNAGFLSQPELTRVLPRSLLDWYGSSEGQWFHDVVTGEIAQTGGQPTGSGFSVPVRRGEAATGYLAHHGARLLFGTDTPSAPTYANPPGLNAWWEMHRWVDAGATPAQVFAAATLTNARALKLDREVGTVQVGKRANLLLLRADPTQTIQAYTAISKVILGGRVLDPGTLRADHADSGGEKR